MSVKGTTAPAWQELKRRPVFERTYLDAEVSRAFTSSPAKERILRARDVSFRDIECRHLASRYHKWFWRWRASVAACQRGKSASMGVIYHGTNAGDGGHRWEMGPRGN
jgi:hypothetical protein